MKFYGIKNKITGKKLGFRYSANNSDDRCCESISFVLDENTDNIWLVSSIELAQAALKNNTSWYNAEYNSPSHGSHRFCIDMTEYEVFEIEI